MGAEIRKKVRNQVNRLALTHIHTPTYCSLRHLSNSLPEIFLIVSCTHTPSHTHTHTHTHMHTHTNTNTYTHAHTHIHTYMHTGL